MISRRRVLLCAAAVWLAGGSRAFAQTAKKVYRVGFVSLRAGPAPVDEAFVRGMRELGYALGRNLVIEYRWSDNDATRLQPLAQELVRLKVDVIVVAATPVVRAAMRATDTIPIVIAAASDPVGTGLVASLAHPGGNVTGMTLLSTDLAGKRLQLVREIIPGASKVALLAMRSPGPEPEGAGTTDLLIADTKAAGRQLGVDIVAKTFARAEELPDAFALYRREHVQALIVQVSPLSFEHRAKIVELAARDRLPAMYEVRNFVDDGGFVSYGPDLAESYRRAASFVDRILKGAKPGDLAVEQPGKYEMVINLKTAKALGLTMPQAVLLRATEVIQ